MKNIPLVLKIWLVFASLTLSLFMLLAFSLPWTLKGFFTEQIYDILLDSQKAVPKDVIRINLKPNNAAFTTPSMVPAPLTATQGTSFGLATPTSPAPFNEVTASADSATFTDWTKLTSPGSTKDSGTAASPSPVNGSETSANPSSSAVWVMPTSAIPILEASSAMRTSPNLNASPLTPNSQVTAAPATTTPASAPANDPELNATVQEPPMMLQTGTMVTEGQVAKVSASTVLRIAPTTNGPGIQHVVMAQKSIPATIASTLPQPFVQAIELDAGNQQAETQSYSLSIAERTMFYVISKEQFEGNTGYMISYAWGNYRNDLVMTMFWRLMLLIVVLIMASWLPCLWLARYLSRPLVLMEQQAARMAERDWHEPFVLNRKDEMGRLAQAFESMRQRLVRQDKAQQFFLQNISHELKTPVMVIHSYAQSILDGIYPKGSVTASVETIMSEAVRLEKRVKDLLYLNKLNYLSTRERQSGKFDLAAIIGDCTERLRYRRQELTWQISLPPILLEGDSEQWSVAIENVLDNQMRYANSEIKITFEQLAQLATDESGENDSKLVSADGSNAASPSKWTVRIWNDGPPVDEEVLATIFEQFQTGADGQFGLGLAISRQILAYHHASIRACNEHAGVAFYLEAN
ncbi:HAMP domain-containing protein [Paenibacillus agricola]|uniref:histidine kinase n=1 Tax=Paenibacillus agricola TaxID=2716264 RepID=A0ABX0J5U2_9BACL|nr:HAMP domain-containing protein [Paenibacillus agricola]NHN31008.1 HAMP domain-containing protein [Paenibacillus agricola]